MRVNESTPPLARSEGLSKGSRSRSRQTPHPTATLLLNTAVNLLDEIAIDGLTIAKVLETSGVSYGSLYHHYADISDLIEHAVVFRYTRNLLESLAAIRSLLDSRDAADFRYRAEQLIEASISPERRQNRLERVEVLGALHGRPRLVSRLAQAQQDITNEQAEIFTEFQRRGWIRSDADPVALSAFTQAMIVGRIVDDITEHPLDAGRWFDVAIRAFRAVLFPD
jgi:AcrR family transcriptional regulator